MNGRCESACERQADFRAGVDSTSIGVNVAEILGVAQGRIQRAWFGARGRVWQGDHSSWKVMENSQDHGKSWKMLMMSWNFL